MTSVGSVTVAANNIASVKFFPITGLILLESLQGGVTGTNAEVVDMEFGGAYTGGVPAHVIVGGVFSSAGGQSHQNLAFYHRLAGIQASLTDVRTTPTAKVTNIIIPWAPSPNNTYTIQIAHTGATYLQDAHYSYTTFSSPTTMKSIKVNGVFDAWWDP